MLTARLNALVEAGLMERRPQQDGGDRHDYHLLTELGMATWEILASVWGSAARVVPGGAAATRVGAHRLRPPGATGVDVPALRRRRGHAGRATELDPESLVLVARSGRR